MHPEIVRGERGADPICGMALEPREVAAEGVNPELVAMTHRFWISVALTAPVAAGILYPFFGLVLSHMIASAAMTLSSVSVISNALRLRKVKL